MVCTLKVQPFGLLLKRILKEYETRESIFGIHHSLLHTGQPKTPYALNDLYGQLLLPPSARPTIGTRG